MYSVLFHESAIVFMIYFSSDRELAILSIFGGFKKDALEALKAPQLKLPSAS